MANIKSAKKRVLVNQTKALRNKMIKSGVKEAAKAALLSATSIIDKATSKGVYHKNTSSRKIGRMTVAVNKMN